MLKIFGLSIILALSTLVSQVRGTFCYFDDGDFEFCDNGCCGNECCFSIGAIIGIVIGGIILLIIGISFIVCCCCMFHNKGATGTVQPSSNTNAVFVSQAQYGQPRTYPSAPPYPNSNPYGTPPPYSNYGAYPPMGSSNNYSDPAFPPTSSSYSHPPPAYSYNDLPNSTGAGK